jgi:poly(A) polymerase
MIENKNQSDIATEEQKPKALVLEADVITRDQHCMRNTDLSPNTLKVLQTLIKHDYQAYAVGGCVRDKLMGASPKDFDVVTNATPEQIKACFRNCRLIGRRFRLAHITFGREIIEVATFRGHHDKADEADSNAQSTTANVESTDNSEKTSTNRRSRKPENIGKQNDKGQLVRDNIFGSIEEDAARRDFTFNAMYFDVRDESILDFANGMASLNERDIVMIGDSDIRFTEDPVRMIRAIRFACKLHMRLPKPLSTSIKSNAHLLANIPAARLFEEVNKLLLSGAGAATFESLLEHNILGQLFPLLAPLMTDINSKEYLLVINMLKNTDKRVNNDQRITPAFLYATFLWYPMEERAQERMFESSMPLHDAMNLASADVLFHQSRRIMIPKRFSAPVREIWSLQLRLQKRQGRRCLQLLTHPKFRAAYDFLLLRGTVEGGQLLETAQWWTSFQEVDEAKRNQMIKELGHGRRAGSKPRSQKKPRNNRKKNNASTTQQEGPKT